MNVRLPRQPNDSAMSSVFAAAGRMAQLGRLVAPTSAPPRAMPAFSAASNSNVACAGVTAISTTSAFSRSLAAGAYATTAGSRSSVGMPATSAGSR